MTPEQETKVLAQLYDRLYDAVTYAPPDPNKPAAWDKRTTFIQMAKNMVLDPDDFKDMFSAVHPEGDLRSAEQFALLCDAIPNAQVLWSDSSKKVSETYALIVNGANTSETVDPDQKELYNKAFAFLNDTITKTDFKGNKKTVTQPSEVAIGYDDARAAYITAIGGYRTAFNQYDMTKPADQRAWNAASPPLDNLVTQTWNAWGRSDKADVEDAQQALASSINNAVSAVIASSQVLISPARQLASPTGVGTFLPTFAIPTTWADPASQASHLHFDSSNMTKDESTSATSYAASAHGSWGLWSAGGGGSHDTQDEHTNMQADKFELDADLVFVQIKRPWLNPLLLSMKGWSMKGQDAGGISNGKGDDPQGLMALLPTGFVIARNVTVSANFSEEDTKFHSESTKAEASVGWGPFSVSGSYAHSSSDKKFTSTMSGGKLSFQGLQIIAWISSIMPFSPPAKDK